MTGAEQDTNRRVLKEFAEAVSTQAQVANRIWLGLMTVALVALLPRESSAPGSLELPFSLGKVDAETFSVIVFGMLVVLTIAFSSAYAQQSRAHGLAQAFLKLISVNANSYGGASPREWFDMLRLPTFNRVAPLPQSLRGKWLGIIRVCYYFLLRLIAMSVYFGLPAYALFRARQKTVYVGSLGSLITVGTVLAMLTLIQVCLNDIAHTGRVLRIIWSGDPSQISV
jgi:hypothetical protein